MNPELSRMADFQMWGEACESAMGLAPGEFAEAYAANQEAASRIILESSPVVQALLVYLQKNGPKIEATATKLLEKLTIGNNYTLKERPGWPKSPRVLSAILKRVAPNLRQIGIFAVQDTRGGGDNRENTWRITAPPKKKKKKKAGRKGKKGSKFRKTI